MDSGIEMLIKRAITTSRGRPPVLSAQRAYDRPAKLPSDALTGLLGLVGSPTSSNKGHTSASTYSLLKEAPTHTQAPGLRRWCPWAHWLNAIDLLDVRGSLLALLLWMIAWNPDPYGSKYRGRRPALAHELPNQPSHLRKARVIEFEACGGLLGNIFTGNSSISLRESAWIANREDRRQAGCPRGRKRDMADPDGLRGMFAAAAREDWDHPKARTSQPLPRHWTVVCLRSTRFRILCALIGCPQGSPLRLNRMRPFRLDSQPQDR